MSATIGVSLDWVRIVGLCDTTRMIWFMGSRYKETIVSFEQHARIKSFFYKSKLLKKNRDIFYEVFESVDMLLHIYTYNKNIDLD